jgi:hypothetical protein
MELHQVDHKDEEFALKGLRQQTRLGEMGGKVKMLEESLKQVVNESRVEKETSAKAHERRMAAINTSTREHSHTIQIKTKEIGAIRNHARTILVQRNQVEKLFLRALETVKTNVLNQRHQEFITLKRNYDLKVKDMTKPQSDGAYPAAALLGPPPRPPPRQALTLADLTQPERDQSLRLVSELMQADPEACAIMGEPFTNQGAYKQSRAQTVEAQYLESLSRPGSGLLPEQQHQEALTFLTDPSMSYEERERDLQAIM